MNLHEITEEIVRLSGEVDRAIDELYSRSSIWAKEEDIYRLAKAKAYIGCEEGTVKDREAAVDIACSEKRYTAHLAEAMVKACTESVRSKRVQLQALMSLMGAARSEMELAR